MISYRDRAFCISPNCSCSRKLTREIQDEAEKWWNPEDKPEMRDQAPISVGWFCGESPNEKNEKKESSDEQ